MKLYLKLALDGIRKNKRLYIPYMLTGAVMVMMYFIVSALSVSPMLACFKGGRMLGMILPFGVWVIAIFAAVFLFYCNAFIIRQRNREFGLYNVLGMGKADLTGLMAVESLLTAGIAILCGLILGLSLEKLAELGMLRILGEDVDYALHIEPRAIVETALVFGVIYLLLLLSAVIRVWRCDPLALLKSAQVGEKPPKANWLLAVLGLVLLAVAYAIALTIKNPMEALVYFFIAVVLVIIATYLLLVAGSVVLCRLLQRNPRYYYKPNHFVSVSTMAYRMKRNGAGLASICILMTMVLVTLSSVLCLYIGAEDTLLRAYPRDVALTLHLPDIAWATEENLDGRREKLQELVPGQVNPEDYLELAAYGLLTREGSQLLFTTKDDVLRTADPSKQHIGDVTVRDLADFNRATGSAETLAPDECLVASSTALTDFDSFAMDGSAPYRIQRILGEKDMPGTNVMTSVTRMLVVVPDLPAFIAEQTPETGSLVRCRWNYAFDLEGGSSAHEAAYDTLMDNLKQLVVPREDGGFTYTLNVRDMQRSEFYGLYGGLFFVGLLLSAIFLFAAVLIVYYKQLSEGYEDQKRFAIMQKVGMTQREIRRSINSQVLTVFFLPLLMAGVHLIFAFPMVWQLLMLFNLNDRTLMIVVTALSFAVFGLVYALVYRITSNVYYGIVSGGKGKDR
ncbi:MAG: ABC transporter permease [Clostridiales bacterium]|nr:ABC transporter permease [Clostridiales bacterium]